MSDLSAQKQAAPARPLSSSLLADLPQTIDRPLYDRNTLRSGIVHMSVGGFHRSHQALYLHDYLQNHKEDWMICGVGLLPQDDRNMQALADQEGLYSILERQATGDTLKICGSMKEIHHAPSNPGAVLARLQDEAIRILSLTITEKGYCYNLQGDLDLSHKMIQHDLQNLDAPQTGLGYVVAALKQRRQAGAAPFTVMSCDNLPGNGHLTQKLVLQFAREVDPDLAQWIEGEVRFPNAMVDRITPVTTPEIVSLVESQFGIADQWPVVCEDFRQWVLEDSFSNGRPDLESVGVQLVADVEPYEKMKVRLLNGSHSALSYLSYLMGYRRVDLAMADPLMAAFVRAYMDHDITASVPAVPGIDLTAYKDKLIERFANPAIGDQVQRLAEDGSQKIPNAILPCALHQLQNGGSVRFIALALAGWFRYLAGTDEEGQAIAIKDPALEKMQARVKASPQDPAGVLALDEIFGALGRDERLIAAVRDALAALYQKGARQTVQDYLA